MRFFLNIIGFNSFDTQNNADILIVDLFLGFIGLPIIVFAFTITGYILNTLTVFAFSIIVVSCCVIVHRRKFKNVIETLVKWKEQDTLNLKFDNWFKVNWNAISIAGIFILGLFVRSSILPGLYVPLGGDAKMWTFFCNRVVESGGFVFDREPYTYLAIELDFHRYLIGFPSLVSFFSLLSGVSVPLGVLLLTSMIGACFTLSIYYFVSRVTENTTWALSSALICSLLSKAMFDFYSWGGNGELASLFLVPIVIYLLIRNGNSLTPARFIVILGIVGIMILYHPYSFFYTLCAVLPVSIWRVTKRADSDSWLLAIVVIIVIGLTALLLSFVGTLPGPMSHHYSRSYWEWRIPFFNVDWSPFQPNFDWSLFWPNLAYNFGERYHSLGNTILALIGLGYVGYKYQSKEAVALKQVLLPIAWIIMLFILLENHPFGLYLIEYPLWYIIYPERIYLAMSLPLIFLSGAGLLAIWDFAKTSKNHISAIDTIGPIQNPRLNKILGFSVGVIIILITSMLLIVPDFNRNMQVMSVNRRNVSPVTSADANAFDWMIDNLPSDSIIIADEYDAGQYLLFFSDFEVRPPLIQVWRDFPPDLQELHDRYLECPDNSTTVSLLHKYNITHIYIGAVRFYGWEPRLNASAFDLSLNYELVYSRDGINIFSVL